MGRPQIPLSGAERSLYPFAVVVVVLGVAVATLALSVGRVALAALSVGVAATYALAVWSIQLRTPWLTAVLTGTAAIATGYLAGHPVVGAAVALFLVGWIAQGAFVRFDPETIRVYSGDAMDPRSAAHVFAFESLGFQRVGALSFEPSPGKTIIATVLIGPGRDRYAVATDLVMTVQSVFGQRVLTTRNSGVATLPPEVLGNDLRGADAAELSDAHESALAVLRARGLKPDSLLPERLLEFHMALERRAIEWLNSRARRQAIETFGRSGLGAGALDERPSSQRRIDNWLDVAAPAS